MSICKRIERINRQDSANWRVHFIAQQLLRRRRRMDDKKIVEAAGSVYRGEMKDDKIGLHLVLFDDHYGSSLALEHGQLTVDAIKKHVAQSDAKWLVERTKQLLSERRR